MLNNKWFRAAIPALLIHSCIGSVYCWSLLKADIASLMECPVSSIEFAFSLAIFFLGMSAAFGGRFVEKNVTLATITSGLFFGAGLLVSILAINFKDVNLLMLGYGCLMGVGLGIGYLSPVKTLMLWFSEHKGLATGIAISGFGLSKVLFSPFIEWCNVAYGVKTTLALICAISVVCIGLAALLIKKPLHWKEPKTPFKIQEYYRVLQNPTYIKIWIVFYLNITCGLALIAFEKSIAVDIGVGTAFIALLASATAFFNTAGRFFYSMSSDYTQRKETIYKIIFASSLIVMALASVSYTLVPVVVMLMTVNAGYGGGFSTLPTLLQSKFGMEKISTIHGLALSAWAWAGLSGNQLSNLLVNTLGLDYVVLFIVLAALYALSLGITYSIKKT